MLLLFTWINIKELFFYPFNGKATVLPIFYFMILIRSSFLYLMGIMIHFFIPQSP